MEFVLSTVASWLTPTTLFLLLNLMIGTIVITSRFGSGPRKHHPPDLYGSGHAHHQAPLARTPSLIDRVKSINFHLYKFPSPETDLFTTTHHYPTGSDPHQGHDPPPLARAPSLLDRVKSINLSHFKFPQYHPENDYAPTTRPDYDNPVGPTRNENQPGSTDPADPTRLARAPSLLQRVKSINFSSFYRPDPTHMDEDPDLNPVPQNKPQYHPENDYAPTTRPEDDNPVDPPRLARSPSLLQRVKSINFSSFYRPDPTHMDEDPDPNPVRKKKSEEEHKPKRSKSETKKPAKKAAQRMTKSASEKHAEAAETAEAVERRRPETMRVERSTSFGDGEEGVDAKASDFINKFKQQLKLQRLDSILRYKEMLKAN